jgi:hypothetical protein
MDYIFIKDLAIQLKRDRVGLKKQIQKLGYKIFKKRQGSHLADVLIKEDADKYLKFRQDEGFNIEKEQKGNPYDIGAFYIIQLIPEYDKTRIKFGFGNVKDRLIAFKTVCPNAIICHTWPCKRIWELTVIDVLSTECKNIKGEVFECKNIEKLIEKGNSLFSLLPKIS